MLTFLKEIQKPLIIVPYVFSLMQEFLPMLASLPILPFAFIFFYYYYLWQKLGSICQLCFLSILDATSHRPYLIQYSLLSRQCQGLAISKIKLTAFSVVDKRYYAISEGQVSRILLWVEAWQQLQLAIRICSISSPPLMELGKRLFSQALKNKTQVAESDFKATLDFYPHPLKLFHRANSFTWKPQRVSVSFVVCCYFWKLKML